MLIYCVILATCLTVLPPGTTSSVDSSRSTSLQVQVSPNSGREGLFFLDLSQCHAQGWVEVRVLNVIGREMSRISLAPQPGSRIGVDIRHLPTGIYLLEVTQGSCKQVRRILYQ